MVRHPGAVCVVALDDQGRVLVVRQYRTALERVTVEVPAGKLDPGEDPEDAVRRELAEEPVTLPERFAALRPLPSQLAIAMRSSTSIWQPI